MKIKILKSCSGYSFSFAEGETHDVEKRIGEDLVACGFAEEIKTAKTAAKKETKSKAEAEDNADA